MSSKHMRTFGSQQDQCVRDAELEWEPVSELKDSGQFGGNGGFPGKRFWRRFQLHEVVDQSLV